MSYLLAAIAEFFEALTFFLSFPPYITQSIANYFLAASGVNNYIEEEEENENEE